MRLVLDRTCLFFQRSANNRRKFFCLNFEISYKSLEFSRKYRASYPLVYFNLATQVIKICEKWLPLQKKFKLCRCSLRRFQVDCFSTSLAICVWNWYKICFLLVFLGSPFNCIMPFPQKLYQFINLTEVNKVINFLPFLIQCILYIEQGRHSCPEPLVNNNFAISTKSLNFVSKK